MGWKSFVGVMIVCEGLGWQTTRRCQFLRLLLQLGPSTPAQSDRTGSPITWLSICCVRLMPMIPKTTKTMAPVSTSGRTAGFPQPVFTQGLKPKVAEMWALGTAGESQSQH